MNDDEVAKALYALLNRIEVLEKQHLEIDVLEKQHLEFAQIVNATLQVMTERLKMQSERLDKVKE